MATVQVSRTLVKSPPELWSELAGERLLGALGEATVHPKLHERELSWAADGVHGTALLEPSGWGTKVTLTAEVEEAVAAFGVWTRLRGRSSQPPPDAAMSLERRLEGLLDDLGSAHRRPFTR